MKRIYRWLALVLVGTALIATLVFGAARAEWPCCSANPDGHAVERTTEESAVSEMLRRIAYLEARIEELNKRVDALEKH